MKKLVRVYKKLIRTSKKRIIDWDPKDIKPKIYSGIFSIKTELIIHPDYNNGFRMDKKSVIKIIKQFENSLQDEFLFPNIERLIEKCRLVVNDFLGHDCDIEKRARFYLSFKKKILNLSEFEGKNIGACAERAAIAHQCLNVFKASCPDMKYSIHYAITRSNGMRHAVILFIPLLEELSNVLLWDITNDVFCINNFGMLTRTVALYELDEQEYSDFLKGKVLCPKHIYEKKGRKVIEKLSYGG